MLATNPSSNILAVDDEPQILTALEDLLEEDYVVVTTTDPLQALDNLRSDDFSVILSDQRMPHLTGDEFLARARRLSSASRVLITGYTDITAAQRAVNYGKIFAYVSKPWDPIGLRKVIDEGVAHHRLVRDLELSHERKLSLDAARAGMWSWNPEMEDLFWDESMQRLFGCESNDLPKRLVEWAKLLHPEDRSAFEAAATVSINDGSDFDVTFRARRDADSWRHFHVQAVGVRDDGGQVVRLTGLCLDVTAQKETENRLRRFAERLQKAQRNQAAQIEQIDRQRKALERQTEELDASNRELRNFAAITAHDLKEPLRTIAFHTSLLEEEVGEQVDEQAKTHILAIRDLARRLSSLIDAILNYMRLGQNEIAFVPKDLNEVLAHVLNVLSMSLKERGAQVSVVGRFPTVLCTPDLIGEVFYNLISNAAKYSDKENGWIEVSVEGSTSAQDDPFVTIQVRDNGIGIDPAQGERVFQMFRRLHGRDEYGGGAGVGLALAKRIVELHRGRIWFDSVPGQGTTFRFTLPKAAPAKTPERPA